MRLLLHERRQTKNLRDNIQLIQFPFLRNVQEINFIASMRCCVYSPLMQINLISVGHRMPSWVQQGYDEYAKRMPKECQLVLKEITSGKRGKNSDVAKIVKDEGERMIKAVSARTNVVVLDISGKPWTTQELSLAMKRWLESGQNIALMVGGPEGLADSVRDSATESWSLSRLTFPHPLVRVVVAEQLYRAWSLLNNHPYHRE